MDSAAMKSVLMAGVLLGSVIGGGIPSLFGAGLFSMWGVVGSTVGAILGLWIAYRFASD